MQDGTAPIKNSGSGINIGDSPGNIIGGVEADRNIIFDGIQIAGSSSIGNIVKGNFFGTDYEGKLALGDGAGIVLYSGASENYHRPGQYILRYYRRQSYL